MNTSLPLPITATILTKNSERCLKEVLDALASFDEVLLLDNGSTDQTLNIAARYPNVSIRHHEFDGFGAMKNRAAALARNDWILSIDSDEVLTPQLLQSIAAADFRQPENIYTLSRLNHYRRRPIKGCNWYPDIVPRLYNRNFTRFSDRAVHETLLIPEQANVIPLSGSLLHYSFDRAEDLIHKMQQYSSLYAEQFRHTKRSSASGALLHGMAAWVKSYLFKQGWRYGTDGLTISVSQAAGAFYKYAKLNEYNRALPVSLIITTYNRPDALQKVLYAATAQTVLPQEILIADDGSGEETANMVRQFAAQSPVPVRHIWQEDDGFRLAQSRNRALAAARGEYIVMIDGDMVLHPDFIADHIQAAQKGCFIQGSRVLLSREKTAEMLSNAQRQETLHWWSGGILKRLSAVRCGCLNRWIWHRSNRNHHSTKGCNMGFFRADALAVNGFNNEFVGWGREDSEFVARLFHYGLVRRNLKFGGIAYHLWHHEAERAALPQNDALLKNTLEQRLVRCKHGVNDFLNAKE